MTRLLEKNAFTGLKVRNLMVVSTAKELTDLTIGLIALIK
jgi:hypothetical protein